MNALQSFVGQYIHILVAGFFGILMALWALSQIRKSILRYGFVCWEKTGTYWTSATWAIRSLKVRWNLLEPQFYSGKTVISPWEWNTLGNGDVPHTWKDPLWKTESGGFGMAKREWRSWRYWNTELKVAIFVAIILLIVSIFVMVNPFAPEAQSLEDTSVRQTVEIASEPTAIPATPTASAPASQEEAETSTEELIIDLSQNPHQQIYDWLYAMDDTLPDMDLPTVSIPWLDGLLTNSQAAYAFRFENGFAILSAHKVGTETWIVAQYADYNLEAIGTPIAIVGQIFTLETESHHWGIWLQGTEWHIYPFKIGRMVVVANGAEIQPLATYARIPILWYLFVLLIFAIGIVLGYSRN